MTNINTFHAVTKKSKGSAALTISSLTKEVSDGIVFIFGGVTDAFGAAHECMSECMSE